MLSFKLTATRLANRRFFSTAKGSVKWFDPKKGFGFIVPEDGSQEIFVHQSAIHAEGFRSLRDGEPVEFEASVDERGRLKADKVTGPLGAFVQGSAPRTTRSNDFQFGSNSDYDFDDSKKY